MSNCEILERRSIVIIVVHHVVWDWIGLLIIQWLFKSFFFHFDIVQMFMWNVIAVLQHNLSLSPFSFSYIRNIIERDTCLKLNVTKTQKPKMVNWREKEKKVVCVLFVLVLGAQRWKMNFYANTSIPLASSYFSFKLCAKPSRLRFFLGTPSSSAALVCVCKKDYNIALTKALNIKSKSYV